jgi:hypothetical protein
MDGDEELSVADDACEKTAGVERRRCLRCWKIRSIVRNGVGVQPDYKSLKFDAGRCFNAVMANLQVTREQTAWLVRWPHTDDLELRIALCCICYSHSDPLLLSREYCSCCSLSCQRCACRVSSRLLTSFTSRHSEPDYCTHCHVTCQCIVDSACVHCIFLFVITQSYKVKFKCQ